MTDMHITPRTRLVAPRVIMSRPFNAAEWLARFLKLGGHTRMQDGQLWLHWSLDTSRRRMMAIKAHVEQIADNEAKTNAVRAIATAQGSA